METREAHPSVEAIREVISYLVVERQSLRSHGAGRPELEANRKALVSMQSQLGHALGERYGAPPARTAPRPRTPSLALVTDPS
jgi:hypothetical protein